MSKTCKICLQEKDNSEFYTNKKKDKVYLHSYCKVCMRAYVAKAKAEKKEQAKAWGENVKSPENITD